ncbi:hypothetical protein I6N95_07100 [Vagococcus sp. BWB3-3]|uniref:Uncharacterized protein n=1 Tax=Vagococcus allomyrinae TaxID=2794353 RepID=A0A940SRF7_9ENTE|nr:hypothetical protein [Vagococcus allomyrinae]MBP1040767.1 hypothetical protein [Vagococcus allomyrinae]
MSDKQKKWSILVIGIILMVCFYVKIPSHEIVADEAISQLPPTEKELKEFEESFSRNEDFNKDKAFAIEESYSVDSTFILDKESKSESPLLP